MVHSTFSPLLLWITHTLCLEAEILSLLFQRFDRGGCVMEFTITPMGAPFPALLPPCEWKMISIPPPSISSFPWVSVPSPCPGPLSLQTELHSSFTSSLSLPLTQIHTHSTFCSLFLLSLHLSARLHDSDKLWQQWKYVSVVTVSPRILFTFSSLHDHKDDLRKRLSYTTHKLEMVETEFDSTRQYLETELRRAQEELEKFTEKLRRCVCINFYMCISCLFPNRNQLVVCLQFQQWPLINFNVSRHAADDSGCDRIIIVMQDLNCVHCGVQKLQTCCKSKKQKEIFFYILKQLSRNILAEQT